MAPELLPETTSLADIKRINAGIQQSDPENFLPTLLTNKVRKHREF
tara:strand:- start:88 stop:225 length:138 start_codon:yes stop_codon:yes gene_type:complete